MSKRRNETNDIMGLRNLVYGACAGIVLLCLALAVLVL